MSVSGRHLHSVVSRYPQDTAVCVTAAAVIILWMFAKCSIIMSPSCSSLPVRLCGSHLLRGNADSAACHCGEDGRPPLGRSGPGLAWFPLSPHPLLVAIHVLSTSPVGFQGGSRNLKLLRGREEGLVGFCVVLLSV